MSLERDFYEERRRRWRRSAFWRGVLVTLAVLIGLGVLGAVLGRDAQRGPHIARITVTGTITDNPARAKLLAEVARDANARAVIVRINSPGGTVAGSEALYTNLRAIAEQKPLVATMGEVAASGGYIAALAADHVVARGGTMTGSIGVIVEYPQVAELLDDVGVEIVTIRSSDIKGGPSPFRDLDPAQRAEIERLIADSNGWFRDLVADRRGLSGAALEQVATGGVFTGRMAIDSDLIDAIGGEQEARAWLTEQDAGLADLRVRDRKVPREDRGLLRELLGSETLDAVLDPQWTRRLLAVYR
ncbi:MAG: signal peptide peptidase SppA [Pseudomonadota bacterium]